MSTVAGGILTSVLSKLSTQLGATFTESPDLFRIDDLPSYTLENSYGAIFLDGSNGQNQIINKHRITRRLRVMITYRTYARPDGANTKTVLQTLYENEEAVINLLTKFSSPPAGYVGTIDPVTTSVETKDGKDDKYLINTLEFNIVYEFAMT